MPDSDFNASTALLKRGQPPDDIAILREITVGLDPLLRFIRDEYYESYINLGGSKIKFVTGKTGSGKTHFLRLLSAEARDCGYITIHISARDVWLHDFKEIYSEIFKCVDLKTCLKRCAAKVVEELGHDCDAIPPGQTFVDYLSSLGELDAITRKEIRNQLRELFIKNTVMDNNFAIACSLLTGNLLGHPITEDSNEQLLIAWLSGNKDVKLPALRNLGLSPAKITKHNARHMLRSLLEILNIAGIPGIVVLIDDLEALNSATSLDTIRYTKMKRDDVYESIRELIDAVDTLKNILFFFAFDRVLLDDERAGLKSYVALWMRMQNEIISNRFNKFSDFYDLDKFAESAYDNQTLVQMSSCLAAVINVINKTESASRPINETQAAELLKNAKHTAVSLPRQVVNATINGVENSTQTGGAVCSILKPGAL